jgi:hypothetical protein
VDIKYEPLAEGKSLPVEMKAKADQNDIRLQMTWKKIENLTLAESLTIAFVGDDGTTRTSSLRLSNYKINQPLPAGISPATSEKENK